MTPFHLYLYGPQRGPIATSFEAAQARLEGLPKMYFEPDGSFVWARRAGQERVFGMIYDAEGMVQYCELQGQCSLETWRELCQAIVGGAREGLEVLLLPGQTLQDLQSFEDISLEKTDSESE